MHDENLHIRDLHVLSDSVCWRMDSNPNDTVSILKTLDAGHLWVTKLNFVRSSGSGYTSLFLNDENTGFVVGSVGIIKFSENGEWERIESGTTLPLRKVLFVDELSGFITGGYSNDEDILPIMLVTEDGGDHWTKGPDLPYLIHDLHFVDSLLGFAVGEDAEGQGVLLETVDGGSSWNKVALKNKLTGELRALHFNEGIGWAVGDNSLILKYVASNTSNQEYPTIKNEDYFQNYPNPFRTRTVISYQLSAIGDVELCIYDLSGRKVITLVNEIQPAGKHEMTWYARRMNPGIYFCELKAGQGRMVIKMMLSE